MDLVGVRVKLRVLRRTAPARGTKRSREEEAEGSARAADGHSGHAAAGRELPLPERADSLRAVWLKGTVEAYRPAARKLLIVFDVVYGRCVRGGLFGFHAVVDGGKSGKEASKREYTQCAADRKAILVAPCSTQPEGVLCRPWARSLYFDRCQCHQQRPVLAARASYVPPGAENPDDPVTRCLAWSVWVSAGDLVRNGLLERLPDSERLVCLCRRALATPESAAFAGEQYRECHLCKRLLHADCLIEGDAESQLEVATTKSKPGAATSSSSNDSNERNDNNDNNGNDGNDDSNGNDKLPEEATQNNDKQPEDPWTCPFCEAHRVVGLDTVSEPRCIEPRSAWAFWSTQQEPLQASPLTDEAPGQAMGRPAQHGEWVFALRTLRHLCGANRAAMVHRELDALAGRDDEHDGSALEWLALETPAETQRRVALIGEGQYGPVPCTLGTMSRLLNGSGALSHAAAAEAASSVKADAASAHSKDKEGALERFMRKLAARETGSGSAPAKPWQAVKPLSKTRVLSPRGGYVETRSNVAQVEFSACCAQVRPDVGPDEAACIGAKGERFIRKWPGVGCKRETCARLRPRSEAAQRAGAVQGREPGQWAVSPFSAEFAPRPRPAARTQVALYRADAQQQSAGMRRARSPHTRLGQARHNDAAAAAQRRHLRDVAGSMDTAQVNSKQLSLGREKRLRFGKSVIHAWGVFAEEPLAANEFVIEYKGELIRPVLSDRREKWYEEQGIPDYMFRIDDDTICDATRKGSLARFINHSCDPNCYTDIISHDGKKKIVIYAKRATRPGEELSYDYKFPIESDPAEKVPCSCGAANCRKFMN